MAEKGGWGEDEGAMSLASGVSESRRPGVESAFASIYPRERSGKGLEP
jgi:hypothetical protein